MLVVLHYVLAKHYVRAGIFLTPWNI